MKVGRVTGAAVAVLALSLLLCSPALAAEKAIWGPTQLPGGGSAFSAYRDLGVDTFQMTIDMSTVARTRPANPSDPADPAYQWPTGVDRAIQEAAASGIQVAVLATYSPPWANGGQGPTHAPDPADFAAMMSAASKRYPYVRRWMIWGEPNRDDRFLPNSSGSPVGPRAYARVLDAAYGALKSVSSKNIVIGGMTWTGGTVRPAAFLRDMRLPNGKPPRLDWFGHNPFPFRFPNLRELAVAGGYRDISDLDTFGAQLRRTYGPRAKFWLSEFLVLSDRPSQEFVTSVSRAEQGRWLSAAYGIADRLPQVAGLGWLGLLDEPPTPRSSNYGLLTADGAQKPAYEAFRAAPARRLRPRVSTRRRIARRTLRSRGLRLTVRPKIGGRVTVLLLNRRGRKVRRASAHVAGGKSRRVVLRVRRASRGRYLLEVRAPRGETVRRSLAVR